MSEKTKAPNAKSDTKEVQKENLKLWDRVSKTDLDYTKEVTFGRSFTSIDATYQIMNATAEFGPYGKAWGLKNMVFDYIECTGEEKLMTLHATFYTPGAEVETANAINVVSAKGKADADFMKKIVTNTITKELSRLGFNADVFLGKFEDAQYVNELKNEKATENLAKMACQEMEKIKTVELLHKYFIGLHPTLRNNEAVMAKKNELKAKLPAAKKKSPAKPVEPKKTQTYIFTKEVEKWGVEAGDIYNEKAHMVQGGTEKLLADGVIKIENE